LQQLENFVWIINERALMKNSSAFFDGSKDLNFIRIDFVVIKILGILGVRLHHSFTEENLLVDATQLIMNTFTRFLDYPSSFWSQDISVIDCSSTEPWPYGRDVYR
jgi:hypothetical protein